MLSHDFKTCVFSFVRIFKNWLMLCVQWRALKYFEGIYFLPGGLKKGVFNIKGGVDNPPKTNNQIIAKNCSTVFLSKF